MKFLLAPVFNNLLANSQADIVLSVISEADLPTGAAKSASPAKSVRPVENFLRPPLHLILHRLSVFPADLFLWWVWIDCLTL